MKVYLVKYKKSDNYFKTAIYLSEKDALDHLPSRAKDVIVIEFETTGVVTNKQVEGRNNKLNKILKSAF